MSEWNHTPKLPLTVNPLWRWPWQPTEILRWYAGAWIGLTINLLILVVSVLALFCFSPSIEQAASPGLWMLTVLLRNGAILCLVAGGCHWWFHSARMQGQLAKYDPRPYPRQGRVFTWNDQLRDNVTWSLCSAVPIWSALECLIWLGLGQGWITHMVWSDHPVWFFAFFLLLPIWESLYFYWIHRLLHTKALYRFHALHHRNTDVGPWSGLSMHPVEHILFFGSVLVHFTLPTHPLHLIFHLQFYALYAAITHTGHEGLWIKGAKRLHLGNFHHQMHQRYFEVNYGTLEIPWDKLFGTFHDGSEGGKAMMRARLRARR